ncbi:MAG: hypothetical protein ACPGO5_00020 [Patescibacteria group bacterium]
MRNMYLMTLLLCVLLCNVAFGQKLYDGTVKVKIDQEESTHPAMILIYDSTAYFAAKMNIRGTDRYITGVEIDDKPRVYYMSSGGNDYTGGRDNKIHLKKNPGSTYTFSCKVELTTVVTDSTPVEKTKYTITLGGIKVGNATFCSFDYAGKKFGFTRFVYNGTTRYIAGMLNGKYYKGVYVSSNKKNYYFGTETSGNNFVGGMIKEGSYARQSFSLTATEVLVLQ